MEVSGFNRSICKSFMIMVLAITLTVISIIAAICISRTRAHNLDYAGHHLESITKVKKVVLEDYFSVMEGKLHVIKDNPFVQSALTDMDDAFMSHGDTIDSDDWRSRAEKYDPIFWDICQDLGIDDIILMCPEGSIVYTKNKNNDLGLFVNDGELKNTSFGKAFRFLQNNPEREIVLSDFAPYDPKSGEPMAFLVGRMTDWESGDLIGHVGFSISHDYINKIVNEKTGMGETGITILTGFAEDGSLAMRSDLEFSGKTYVVGDSPGLPSLWKSLEEKEYGIKTIMDENSGDYVLASYMPLSHSDIDWNIVSRQSVNEINSAIRGTVIIITFASALALLLSLIAAFFLSNVISRSIKRTTNAFRDIGEGDGDLTKRIDIRSHNEAGEMSYYFNAFMDKLHQIVSGIKNSTGDTIHISHSLKDNMAETEKFSRDIAGLTEEVKDSVVSQASSVEEVSSTMEEIVRTIEQQDAKIVSQTANITESSAAVEQMVANIQSISRNLNANSEEFTRLNDSVHTGANDISELSSLVDDLTARAEKVIEANGIITNIASQTNLLAMNAAIEAAHAGESGRGFAVVADEIRKLAETSNTQSKSIGENVKTLSETVQTFAGFTKRMSSSFGEIEVSMNRVTDIEKEIMDALNEQSAGSIQVMQALSEISQITSEIHSGSNEMLKGGQGILEEVAHLLESSGTMKNNTMEILRMIERIVESIDESGSAVQKTLESFEEINTRVGVFKTA